jgi:CubicO group peptidase (beta-lactamase class C family)
LLVVLASKPKRTAANMGKRTTFWNMNSQFLGRVALVFATLSVENVSAQGALYFPPATGTWATTTAASLGWCQAGLDSMAAFAGRKNTKALIVLKDGRIVLERYYGTFTADSSWYWASAGKSLTATLVGLAMQDGQMDLNAPSNTYLGRGWTSLSPQREDSIKLIHHMSMSTGLDERLQNPNCTLPACLTYKAPVNTRWYYDTEVYALVQDMLVTATRARNITSYTNTRLATVGVQGLWLDNVFYSKPRSMARFGLLALAKGNWAGTPILSDSAYFRQMTTTSQTDNLSYGLLWWLNGKTSYELPSVNFDFPSSIVPSAPADMFAAMGKNGQLINVVPSMNIVVVRMGDDPDTGLVPFIFQNDLWKKLNTIIKK